MTHIVADVSEYDNRRYKVTLDEGAVAFLLYKGELRQAGIRKPVPGEEALQLTEEQLQSIFREILLPRAKKRVLFYLKNGDKTEAQIRRKLAEGLYPPEVTEEVLEFLRKYRLADDSRLLETYINGLRGKYSCREIEAKLYAKGLSGDAVREALGEITGEEEAAAAQEALRRHCSGDRRKDYAYLARKGFPPEAIRQALAVFTGAGDGEDPPDPEEYGC